MGPALSLHRTPHTAPQIAADNAVFGQTGPKVGSFDAGYGSTHMAQLVGQKKAREIWFLCRLYDAHEAHRMGLVNTVRDGRWPLGGSGCGGEGPWFEAA